MWHLSLGWKCRDGPKTSFKREPNRHKPANESNSISDAGLANVYIEITHDNMESSCLYCASYDMGNQDI